VPTGWEEFEGLTRQGFDLLRAGKPPEAAEILAQALEIARSGDGSRLDEAKVNHAQALEAAGEHERAEEGLLEILMRGREDALVMTAALTVARSRKSRRDYAKALFYAEKALAAARRIGRPERAAPALTLRANIRMNRNQFREALADYRETLRLYEEAGSGGYHLAWALDNLGYCHVLLEEYDEGITHLKRGLETAEKAGLPRLVAETSQDLCFATLRRRSLRAAEKHGRRALAAAEREGLETIRKNVLYLLGETASLLGKDREADAYFAELQKLFPGIRNLGQFLKAFDISEMITLKEF